MLTSKLTAFSVPTNQRLAGAGQLHLQKLRNAHVDDSLRGLHSCPLIYLFYFQEFDLRGKRDRNMPCSLFPPIATILYSLM